MDSADRLRSKSNQSGQMWLTVSHIHGQGHIHMFLDVMCLCSACTCVNQTHTQVHTCSVRSVGEACKASLRCKLRQAEAGLFMVPLTMCA